jgi:hypothetical protein
MQRSRGVAADVRSQSALLLAAARGHSSIAERLVAAKADLGEVDEQGQTALIKGALHAIGIV